MASRQYQAELKQSIYKEWQTHKNVLAVLPTGGGKTWIFSEIVKDHNAPAVAIAHRQEIVGQISLSFARMGVWHNIIAPKNVVKLINRLHTEELGTSFYNPNAKIAVAGVDTLLRRSGLGAWAQSVTLWVQDEAHHVLKNNKWGKAATLFPNARGLGVTATPVRADGKGLGTHHDGLFSCMAIGPDMRTLIGNGFLTDYRVFAPPSDLDMSGVKIGANGDWTQPGTVQAVRSSKITGDVVSHYLRIAPGKLGITFAVDVQTASDIADSFNRAGVPAAVVSAKTSAEERTRILRQFKQRRLLQLVNVDLFGEGFDLPAVEVVSMARPTQSYGLYVQQFGRALRPMDGKTRAIIIDHVGNVIRHGLPDAPKNWTLDRRDKKSQSKPADDIPVKACEACTAVYERFYKACPFCGHIAEPMSRSAPEHVDGDLTELDADTLSRMRGEAVNLDMTREQYLSVSGAGHLPAIAAASAAKRFREKQEAQITLRASIAQWAGYQRYLKRPDSEIYRRFYLKFKIDMYTVQALSAREAAELKIFIDSAINNLYCYVNQ